ncbi:MAG TPA: double zinc ribbon domain-containing protein, partial [Actinomycetota bacterium]|nr:double zinc ribbon domain-containing protein [Actinomycetota bacterium]
MLGLKDVICPEACAGCCRIARGGLCRTCLEEMPRISGAVCRCCGRPLDRPAASCIDCRSRNFRFDAARQAAPFGPVLRKVVHRFKYSGGRSLAAPLCDLVLEAACGLPGTAQAVTWIPPSPERLRRTGVDHGRILAELVAGSLGKPAVALAARTRRTRPQMR